MIQFFLQFIPVAILFIFAFFFLRRQRKKNKYSPFNEKTLRSPGYSLSIQIDGLYEKLLSQCAYLVIAGLVVSLSWNNMTNVYSKAVLLLALIGGSIFVSVKLNSLFDKVWRLRLGYEGEVYTGQELNYLMREGAWVYHDIEYQYGNIDHIIISTGGVFVVETKAVRKPQSKQGRADFKVRCDKSSLKFPHVTTSYPLDQSARHASYLSEVLYKELGLRIKVVAVVALPGWFIENNKLSDSVLVINPKRGKALSGLVNRNVLTTENAELIANRIERFNRSVNFNSDIGDPDASKKYDRWNNRKPEGPKL